MICKYLTVRRVRIVFANMNKSKLFAIIISIPILSVSLIAYAQTYFDPPTLVVTKPMQPVSTIAPSGALHVPFTKVDLTARGSDIIVEEIVVQKMGASDDDVFEDILLLDAEGGELGEGSLDDDHMVHFTEPIYIPRNTTIHVTVAANMAEDLADFEGQIASLSVTSISASGYVKVQ